MAETDSSEALWRTMCPVAGLGLSFATHFRHGVRHLAVALSGCTLGDGWGLSWPYGRDRPARLNKRGRREDRFVYYFELDPVRVVEERRVVTRGVVRKLLRSALRLEAYARHLCPIDRKESRLCRVRSSS